MYCPECRTEYREGFTECADCGVPLVSELPPEPVETNQELVTVMEASDEAVTTMAESLLREANIEYLIKGDEIQDLIGAGRLGMGFNPVTGYAQIQVMPADEEAAREILADLMSSDPTLEEEDLEEDREDMPETD